MDDFTKEAAMTIARLMCASARTAPKTTGVDDIKISILPEERFQDIAACMEELAEERGKSYFARDAKNLLNSDAAIIIGVNNRPVGLNCGACGHDCKTFLKYRKEDADFPGPICVYKSIDLGIALSSAVKTASIHNADNRMMYTIGIAARRLHLIEGDVVIGIPISLKGKNIYFDRKT